MTTSLRARSSAPFNWITGHTLFWRIPSRPRLLIRDRHRISGCPVKRHRISGCPVKRHRISGCPQKRKSALECLLATSCYLEWVRLLD
ncbi:unnamed protein product, partial [Vitis vinifera]